MVSSLGSHGSSALGAVSSRAVGSNCRGCQTHGKYDKHLYDGLTATFFGGKLICHRRRDQRRFRSSFQTPSLRLRVSKTKTLHEQSATPRHCRDALSHFPRRRRCSSPPLPSAMYKTGHSLGLQRSSSPCLSCALLPLLTLLALTVTLTVTVIFSSFPHSWARLLGHHSPHGPERDIDLEKPLQTMGGQKFRRNIILPESIKTRPHGTEQKLLGYQHPQPKQHTNPDLANPTSSSLQIEEAQKSFQLTNLAMRGKAKPQGTNQRRIGNKTLSNQQVDSVALKYLQNTSSILPGQHTLHHQGYPHIENKSSQSHNFKEAQTSPQTPSGSSGMIRPRQCLALTFQGDRIVCKRRRLKSVTAPVVSISDLHGQV